MPGSPSGEGPPSLPTRERGLKDARARTERNRLVVAPYAGAWIESVCGEPPFRRMLVAPYAGAWIERLPRTMLADTHICRSLRGSVD